MAHYEKEPYASNLPLPYGTHVDDGDFVAKGGNADDQRQMELMEKKQEVRRDFRTVSMFGFSLILMWGGILSTASIGLGNGGSAGVLYTNLATWIGFVAIYASLEEMGSMAPTSGGQYHWVSEFAPRQYQKFLSYIVGWLGVLGWQTGVAFSGFLVGTQIQGLLALNYEYVYERWHAALLILAMPLFAVLFTTFLAHQLPLPDCIVLVIHIPGFFCISIPLWVLSPKTPSSQVWTSFNDPGWGNQGLSTLIGITASVAPLLGADAAVNGFMAFVMLITFCYCIGDVESDHPLDTHRLPLHPDILQYDRCITVMAGSSRQLFAFARDHGVPFAPWIAQVRPGFDVPVNALIVSFATAVIIALINIGSTVAFNSVTSLGTGTLTISYIICISCMVWRRTSRKPLLPSRFDMGKRLGLAVNLLAVGFLSLVFVIAFFPPVPLPLLNVVSMNWSSLIFGEVLLFSICYFVVWGRKCYVGPVAYVRRLN